MRVIIVIVFCFFGNLAMSQTPNDCVNAVVICGNGIFSSNAEGIGNSQEVTGCSGMEHNSIWIRINIVQSGTLGFHIRPNDPDLNVDYDFWVYAANRPCNDLGAPIRCATTNPVQAGLTTNHTGMHGTTTITQVGPGADGNGYVRWLTVTAGQFYYIAIDRPEGDGGFELEWIGSATDGDGAFAPPPVANTIPDYRTCSNNPNVGIFDFNNVRSLINPDLINNTITFHTNEGDAFDNINALPNIISNSSNPQQITARVTDNTTGCFSLTSFNLVVYPVPDAEITVSDTALCTGEDLNVTITGTPGSIVEYQINGGAIQSVALDTTGIYMFQDSPSANTVYTLIGVRIEGENNITVCSEAINESVSVTVSEITAPVLTSNGSICVGNDAQITFSNEPGAIINFLLDGIAGTVTLDASGAYTVTVLNASDNVEVELLSIELPTAPFCTLDLTGTIFTVTVNPLPVYENLLPVELCDLNNPGDEQEVFLLDIFQILAAQAGVAYTFHELYADAETNVDALNIPNQTVNYTNTSNPQTLYIRAEDDLTGCFTIMPLELRVLPIPVAIQPNDIALCDTSQNDEGYALFNLTQVASQVLGTQNLSDFSITYYLSQTAAETSSAAIVNPAAYHNSVAGGETIYVRIETNGGSGCFAVTSFNILVYPLPNAAFEMTATCDGATATILGDTDGTFSFSQAPADAAIINTITGEITNVTQGATYFVFYSVIRTNCASGQTRSVTIGTLPNVVTPSNLQECGSIANGAWFDLNSKIPEITSNNTTLSVSFYMTQILAETGNPADALPSPYFMASASQTLYVRVEGSAGCIVYTQLVLELFETVDIIAALPEISECDDDNDTMAVFNLTQIESLFGTHPNMGISYHTTQNGAQNNTGIITNAANYTSATTTVFVRIVNTLDVNGLCNIILPLSLQVNPSPTTAITEIVICEAGSTGFASFDLQSEIPNILGSSQNPSNFTVNFFLDSAATNQIMTNPFVNTVTGTQTIYVQITNAASGCDAVFPLDLQVLSGVQLIQPSDINACDDVSNDGIATFNLTTVETQMLGGQNADLFLITYHLSSNDALNGNNAIGNPQSYQNSGSPFQQIIYIRVQRVNSPDCVNTTQVRLVVNALMNPDIFSVNGNNTICVDFETNELQSGLMLSTNLQGANYTYQWYLNGNEIPGATLGSYDINSPSPGLYSVYVTDTNSNTGCGDTAFSNVFEVIQSGLPVLVSVSTSEPFVSTPAITVVVQGYGDYWFQLNNGAILDNNGVFSPVPSGVHTVTVYDKKTENPSCGFIVIEDIQVIDYPKFFTPNDDGYHDYWNISALQDQPDAKILIYDRYGKILTMIKPQGPGWDGTYNGQRMMSTDYWFVLTYRDNQNRQREFKAHFALRR